jgi:hypothetical protein
MDGSITASFLAVARLPSPPHVVRFRRCCVLRVRWMAKLMRGEGASRKNGAVRYMRALSGVRFAVAWIRSALDSTPATLCVLKDVIGETLSGMTTSPCRNGTPLLRRTVLLLSLLLM